MEKARGILTAVSAAVVAAAGVELGIEIASPNGEINPLTGLAFLGGLFGVGFFGRVLGK